MPASPPTAPPPSGLQFLIGHGRHQAVVTEVGATLRSYTVDGADVVAGFPLDQLAPSSRGQVLAPWPNRLGDGRYAFDGRNARAALDEPERRNAIHGLVRWMAWDLVSSVQNVAVLATTLHPQPGYPWRVDLTVEYRLGRDGLTVTTEARNRSDTPAPFGLGFHPYLTLGTPTVDTVRLLLPARRRLVTDERQLPTGDATVAGTEFDFASARPLGPTRLDTAYTDLVRGPDGRALVELDHPDDGPSLTLWVDGTFKYLMVFTADTVESVPARRASVAVEPMTCPPDALRSGTDVLTLEPGGSWRGSWGILPR